MKTALKRIALVSGSLCLAWVILCNLESISMIKEHRELTVTKPREAVFEFINDNEKISSWVKGIVSVEPFGEPTDGMGAKVKLVVNVPAEMELVSTISEWEPPHRFAWSVDVKEMASTQTYILDEVEGGTKITLNVEHRFKTFFMKLISPLIGMQIKSERAKEMERLKQVIEAL
jgi:carbon monoxide dehydrogenase subunit G